MGLHGVRRVHNFGMWRCARHSGGAVYSGDASLGDLFSRVLAGLGLDVKGGWLYVGSVI